VILVDTSAWIEWLMDTPTGAAVAQHLPDKADWLVPTMVQLELARWLTREVGEEKAEQVLAFTQVCRVVVLDTETALEAAEMCRTKKLATADAIVYATARRSGATLLTRDMHFDGLPVVRLVKKVTA